MPQINIPIHFRRLVLSIKRIKIAYGGRGGGKTIAFATIFILKSLEKRVRIFCAREMQESIEQSVYSTLVKVIRDLELTAEFDIQRTKIVARRTGSEFFFGGLFRNIESKKGLEDVNYVWVSEAANVSEESLQVLLPSIRANDSEVWFDLNPRYETDAVYKRYIANPDPDLCELVQVNYTENPFFPAVLEQQRLADYKILTRDEADHIWLGRLKKSGGFIWQPPFSDIHIRDFKWHEIKDKVNLVMAIDPHQHYYPACLWIAMIKMQHGAIYKWVCDEWPTYGTLSAYYSDVRKKIQFLGQLSDLTREFKTIESQYPVKVLKRFIDSRFAKGVGSAGIWTDTEGIVSQWRKLENGGLVFHMPQEGKIDAQRNVIKEAMIYNPNAPINEINEPTFYVSPNCKNFIQSLRNHKLEADSEKEDEQFKDFSDCCRIGFGGIDKWIWQEEDRRERFPEWPTSSVSQHNAWQGL